MALTKVVTKAFPTGSTVGLHLELKDDDEVVISENYYEQFATGMGVTNKIRDEIGKRMQVDIDRYKQKKAVFETVAYETARTQVDNNLVL